MDRQPTSDDVDLGHVVLEHRLCLGAPSVVDALVIGEAVEGQPAQLPGPTANLEADLEAPPSVVAEQAEVGLVEELNDHGVGDGVADLVVGVPLGQKRHFVLGHSHIAGKPSQRDAARIGAKVAAVTEEPPQERDGTRVRIGVELALGDQDPQRRQKRGDVLLA